MYNPCYSHQIPGACYNRVDEKAPEIVEFVSKLCNVVKNDACCYFHNGMPITVSPSWIRDHVYEMKANKHWSNDLKSFLELIIINQHPDGYFYEMLQPNGEYHTTVVDDTCRKVDNENGYTFVRIEIEADVEFLVVEGAYTVFKATGDRDWISRMLPYLEKSVNYCTSDPKRWDEKHQLMKRPYTVDTWDFAYDISSNFRMLNPDCRMAIMHGDNTGLCQAMKQLAEICFELGLNEKSKEWEKRAEVLKMNLDKTCWNGNFYTHQIPLNCDPVDDLEEQRLSLSNAYAMTRGVVTNEQAQAILNEYRRRRETTDCFAEWFSVDPPYKEFRGHFAGEYINGGIASFTAGELAHAAFLYGQEEYGWDILCRLTKMLKNDGHLFFLYDPKNGGANSCFENGGGPSGWSSAAILAAIDEGLAGIRDMGICYSKINFSPKWAITGMDKAKYVTGYAASHTFVETCYELDDKAMRLQISSPAEEIDCHVLLPQGKNEVESIVCNGVDTEFKIVKINDSVYADFSVKGFGKTIDYDNYQQQKPIKFEIKFK